MSVLPAFRRLGTRLKARLSTPYDHNCYSAQGIQPGPPLLLLCYRLDTTAVGIRRLNLRWRLVGLCRQSRQFLIGNIFTVKCIAAATPSDRFCGRPYSRVPSSGLIRRSPASSVYAAADGLRVPIIFRYGFSKRLRIFDVCRMFVSTVP